MRAIKERVVVNHAVAIVVAIAVALVALVVLAVAPGGTAYAAIRSPAVSIGSTQFKGGAVANAFWRRLWDPPPVVGLQFWYVADADLVWTGTRYALGVGYAPAGYYATLIDDQTGNVTTISKPGCAPGVPSDLEPLSLPWVVLDCAPLTIAPFGSAPPAPELYSPATGEWQTVSPSPGLSSVATDFYRAVGAGTSWLEYSHASCDSGGQHCGSSSVLQNIATGELRQDPSGGTTIADLNAPDLTRTVCSPLTVPTRGQPYFGPLPGSGSLVFYGSFAVEIRGEENFSSAAYLEQCGTDLHLLLTKVALGGGRPLVGANAHQVIWIGPGQSFFSALTLPDLRPFTIALPAPVQTCLRSQPDIQACVSQIALTDYRLYVLTGGQLWAAPSPLPPNPVASVPGPPPPAASVPGRLGTLGAKLKFTLACHGTTGQSCQGQASATVVEKLTAKGTIISVLARKPHSGRYRIVTVLKANVSAAAAQSKHVSIHLNSTGQMLRNKFNHVPADAKITATTEGATTTLRAAKVTFRADPPNTSFAAAPTTKHNKLRFRLRCKGHPKQICKGIAKLTTYEKVAADGKTVTGLSRTGPGKLITLQRTGWGTRAGTRVGIEVAIGRRMLTNFGQIPATLTITPTHNAYTLPPITRKITFKR